MALYLGLLLFSFVITSILVVPFIDLLYKLKFLRPKQKTLDFQGSRTPLFDKFHKDKAGTPVGGGLLIILVVFFLYAFLFPLLCRLGVYVTAVFPIKEELHILFLTFISFGALGLYDDVMKFFGFAKTGFFGLRLRHKFTIQWILALVIALLLYQNLKINFVHIPSLGIFHFGWLYIPVAAAIIVFFANAFNITDGLDGLAAGLLLICLFAFWILSHTILDTPLSIFLALFIG